MNKITILILLMSCGFNATGQVKDTVVLFHSELIYFENDSYSLDTVAIAKLDSLKDLAEESDKIVLEGHTDFKGSVSYNERLSENRVKSVYDELIKLGFTSERIEKGAFGEMRPQEKGTDEVSNQLNRRVTIGFYELQKRRKIKGTVSEKHTDKLLFAKIKITGKDFVDSTYVNKDGSFSIYLPDNRIYKLEIIADCHFFDQQFIKVSSQESTIYKVELPSLDIESSYTLPNFNFYGDQYILLPKSKPVLDLLYVMLDQCDICVEIQGHINRPNEPNCPENSAHYRLSVNRANMVYQDMVDRGIDSTRMLPKGYGNWEMLFPKATREVNAAKNRRVEVKVIDCDSISSLRE